MPTTSQPAEKPISKSILAKLARISEPTRGIYAERLRELKPKNAREAAQLLSEWEGTRARLALTERLSERERKDPEMLEAKAAALARRVVDKLRT